MRREITESLNIEKFAKSALSASGIGATAAFAPSDMMAPVMQHHQQAFAEMASEMNFHGSLLADFSETLQTLESIIDYEDLAQEAFQQIPDFQVSVAHIAVHTEFSAEFGGSYNESTIELTLADQLYFYSSSVYLTFQNWTNHIDFDQLQPQGRHIAGFLMVFGAQLVLSGANPVTAGRQVGCTIARLIGSYYAVDYLDQVQDSIGKD